MPPPVAWRSRSAGARDARPGPRGEPGARRPGGLGTSEAESTPTPPGVVARDWKGPTPGSASLAGAARGTAGAQSHARAGNRRTSTPWSSRVRDLHIRRGGLLNAREGNTSGGCPGALQPHRRTAARIRGSPRSETPAIDSADAPQRGASAPVGKLPAKEAFLPGCECNLCPRRPSRQSPRGGGPKRRGIRRIGRHPAASRPASQWVGSGVGMMAGGGSFFLM